MFSKWFCFWVSNSWAYAHMRARGQPHENLLIVGNSWLEDMPSPCIYKGNPLATSLSLVEDSVSAADDQQCCVRRCWSDASAYRLNTPSRHQQQKLRVERSPSPLLASSPVKCKQQQHHEAIVRPANTSNLPLMIGEFSISREACSLLVPSAALLILLCCFIFPMGNLSFVVARFSLCSSSMADLLQFPQPTPVSSG